MSDSKSKYVTTHLKHIQHVVGCIICIKYSQNNSKYFIYPCWRMFFALIVSGSVLKNQI